MFLFSREGTRISGHPFTKKRNFFLLYYFHREKNEVQKKNLGHKVKCKLLENVDPHGV